MLQPVMERDSCRAVPAAFRRSDGKFQYFHLQENGQKGGTSALALGSQFFNGGFVQSRVFQGQAGSPAAGKWVYEYRVSLTNSVGILNQTIAAVADDVLLVVAGRTIAMGGA